MHLYLFGAKIHRTAEGVAQISGSGIRAENVRMADPLAALPALNHAFSLRFTTVEINVKFLS